MVPQLVGLPTLPIPLINQPCTIGLCPGAKSKVLVIDELTLGLAPVVVNDILPVVQQIASSGVAVLLVEQHDHAPPTIADRCVILQQGRIVFTGTATEVRNTPEVIETSHFGIGSLRRRSQIPSGATELN